MAESEHLRVPGAPEPPLPPAPVCLRCERGAEGTGGWRIVAHHALGLALAVERDAADTHLVLRDSGRRLGADAPNRAIRHVHEGHHPWLCQHCLFVLSGDERALQSPPPGAQCLPRCGTTATAGKP